MIFRFGWNFTDILIVYAKCSCFLRPISVIRQMWWEIHPRLCDIVQLLGLRCVESIQYVFAIWLHLKMQLRIWNFLFFIKPFSNVFIVNLNVMITFLKYICSHLLHLYLLCRRWFWLLALRMISFGCSLVTLIINWCTNMRLMPNVKLIDIP